MNLAEKIKVGIDAFRAAQQSQIKKTTTEQIIGAGITVLAAGAGALAGAYGVAQLDKRRRQYAPTATYNMGQGEYGTVFELHPIAPVSHQATLGEAQPLPPQEAPIPALVPPQVPSLLQSGKDFLTNMPVGHQKIAGAVGAGVLGAGTSLAIQAVAGRGLFTKTAPLTLSNAEQKVSLAIQLAHCQRA